MQACGGVSQQSPRLRLVTLAMRRHWPVRSYPWGVAEALHSTHSDMLALKRLLIELSFEDLKARTEKWYYQCRASHLAYAAQCRARTSGSSAVVTPSTPAGACTPSSACACAL